ncbi:hypothetical protein AVEN_108360-1 [Araneus ventricosus]|uniref:Uncharacterized protein n=1 Tax=Araneus ventricosus TaxID=182803 RepID=A0A4Y2CWY2_ARAVE|nr:hypothetical protein AVEN_108360-1 [Araneus ventricosus]
MMVKDLVEYVQDVSEYRLIQYRSLPPPSFSCFIIVAFNIYSRDTYCDSLLPTPSRHSKCPEARVINMFGGYIKFVVRIRVAVINNRTDLLEFKEWKIICFRVTDGNISH